jgi:serine/threonine-protein kinase
MPRVSTASGLKAPLQGTVPIPFEPMPTPPAPKVQPTAAERPPRKPPVLEGTSVGLAPPPVVAPPKPRTASMSGVDGPLTRRCTSCDELYPADFLVCPRDATPLVALEGADVDPLVGSLIGETYQIVRVVGEGGMGRVYEARHLRLKERRFAVKCLHADLARNAEMAARFLREAETASSIKHDNVVDVFDVHHLPDGTPYLVGEFLEGEELADYVTRRGPLEPRMAAKVTRQVCHALAAAHERGIVHRDMKPENIFVLASSIPAVDRATPPTPPTLRVKVLDFGISKAGPGDNAHLTRTGVIMGTPSYMSPEQARGRPVDHRADVYSVGACLYFMVTGRRPFDSDDPTSTLSMVLTEDPIRPRELDPRIPEMLELIIQRAMAKDANDRYGSMLELEKALATFTGTSSVAVTSESSIPTGHPTPMEIQVTGAARAFDVARAFLGSGSLPPPSQESGNLARTARPTIVITSAALGTWLVGGTVAALAGLVRVLHDGEVTLTESLLLVVGCLFAGATPIALYVMHLRKVIWPNSVRALQLATDLKRTTVSALVTYGAFSILGRIVHTVFWRSSRGLASGVWDISLFALSLAAALTIGGLAPLLRNLRRRRRD